MLGQRRRRWTNIGPTLDGCVVFAGSLPNVVLMTKCCLMTGTVIKTTLDERYYFMNWKIQKYFNFTAEHGECALILRVVVM